MNLKERIIALEEKVKAMEDLIKILIEQNTKLIEAMQPKPI
jgi:hypothetical protein